jgi:hypothetical protein
MSKDKKIYVSFYLEKSNLDRLRRVSQNPESVFDDVSSLIRFCVKMQLPLIEKETFQREEERDKLR